MHNYRVKFYFVNKSRVVDVTMCNREETPAEICDFLTGYKYHSFVPQGGTPATIVNMANVTKIEVTEVNT